MALILNIAPKTGLVVAGGTVIGGPFKQPPVTLYVATEGAKPVACILNPGMNFEILEPSTLVASVGHKIAIVNNPARMLFASYFIHPDDATTPLQRLQLAAQSRYVGQPKDVEVDLGLLDQILAAYPDRSAEINLLGQHLANGHYFKAIKTIREFRQSGSRSALKSETRAAAASMMQHEPTGRGADFTAGRIARAAPIL